MKIKAQGTLCFVALLTLLSCAHAGGERVDEAGDYSHATDFAYQDINPDSASFGQKIRLSEAYADEGVVLNFLASWCGYCWKEIPYLEQMHQDGTRVIGVAADEDPAPPEVVLSLVKRAGSTIPILWVPAEKVPSMEQAYSHGMLPATYVIDGEGRIRELLQGAVPQERLLQTIAHHLHGAAAPAQPEKKRGTIGM